MIRLRALAGANGRALALGLLFLAIVAILVCGNYENRLAIVHEDNGAVFYTYLFAHPAEFARDVYTSAGAHWMLGTICFWLPALAGKYLGLDPRIPDVIFYLLQIALLGLAILLLTWTVARSWLVAFASMALALVIQPWGWNLAAYGSVMDIPLYTSLADALAGLAGAAFLARRWSWAWLLAVGAAVVHPVIGCYLVVMLVPWCWIHRSQWRDWVSPRTGVKTAILLLLCVEPLLVQSGFREALLPPAEYWVSVTKNMHTVPWGNTALFRVLALRSLGFLLVAACCWRGLMALPADQKVFLVAAGIGAVFLGLVQIAGFELHNPTMVQAVGLRALSLFILFAWPFVFAFLLSRPVLGQFASAFTLLLLAAVWYLVESGIPVFNLALFALVVARPQWFQSRRAHIYLLLCAALPVLAIARAKGHWLFPGGYYDMTLLYYLASLIAAAVLVDFASFEKNLQVSRLAVAAGLMALALLHAEAIGAGTRTAAIADQRDAELWARDHTPPGTLFFTKYDWRTLSQRPEFMLMPDLATELYTPFRSIRDRNEFLLDLYGLGKTWRHLSLADIIDGSQAGYARLTSADFANLSKRFAVPYLVRANDEAALEFPIVYQNHGFRIYRLAP